ncbi:MAG: DUF3300 domain-containing protein, partial [Desulfobacterales bacterium]|nr:DUF3300 domain-containing protein [Desulfobacterales bacterium]
MFKHGVICLLIIIGLALTPLAAAAQNEKEPSGEELWPREIVTPKATIILYTPQVERFEGATLDARMATSVKMAKSEEPIFGAVWMSARVETDRDKRLVHILGVETVRSRFPGATPEQEKALADFLKKEASEWKLSVPLDALLTSLEAAQRQDLEAEKLKNDPPRIIYSDVPAVLIVVDGKPILEKIDQSSLMAVVNTPFPMVYDPAGKTYYLMGDGDWYAAGALEDDWRLVSKPPSSLKALEPKDGLDPESPKIDGKTSKIIVVTKPAELISTTGKPQYAAMENGDLLYVSNTENDIIMEPESGRHFLLISGRWYASKDLSGGWRYVPGEELPKSFADIPEKSEKGEVLASIPGTTQAQEAVLDASIPQTAAIVRAEAKLEVEYDGKPKFEQIKGTSIKYAVNTPISVIEVKGKYYAVDNGVWFTASKPTGPWVVADSAPAEAQEIPASSPVYNIKYVYVYDATPQVVYVGYTPGYTCTYVYRGTVVYGTGYYYRPWHGHYYYPHHATWGFNVRYSSYHGWSFGVTYSSGPFSISIGHGWGHYHRHHYHGWWGPPRYRPPYYRPPHHRPPHYRPPHHRPPRPELYRDKHSRANLYVQKSNRVARPPHGQKGRLDKPRATNRPAQMEG